VELLKMPLIKELLHSSIRDATASDTTVSNSIPRGGGGERSCNFPGRLSIPLLQPRKFHYALVQFPLELGVGTQQRRKFLGNEAQRRGFVWFEAAIHYYMYYKCRYR